MSNNVQHEEAWMMHVSSTCLPSLKEKTDISKVEDSKLHVAVVHHDESFTVRDYIGLSAMPASSSTSTMQKGRHILMSNDSSKCSDSRDEEFTCRDTELRLGIGPYNGDANASHSTEHGGHFVPHQHVSPQTSVHKQAEDGAHVSHYWKYGGMSGASSVEFHQSFWPWGPGVVPGRFMIPVPKISTVPAKRPYLEVMNQSGLKTSVCALATDPNATAEPETPERGASHSSSMPPLPTVASSPPSQGSGFYAWSASTGMPPHVVTAAAWQPRNCSNQEGTVGALPAKNSCPTRALPPPPLFKPCPTLQAGQVPPIMSNQPVAPPHVGWSEEGAVHRREVHNEDVSGNRSPVVGWPPVRSFRKKTLQSAAGLGTSKASGALMEVRSQEDTGKANESVADQQSKASTNKPEALFVKARLDGVRICRKVDLASYNSYDSLKAALQEMFQGFVCNDNAKLDLVHGKNYVLTHEDKDGDTMLVGDVPWRMFITTVKSLRIMKAADAVGLGKVSAHLEQSSSVPDRT